MAATAALAGLALAAGGPAGRRMLVALGVLAILLQTVAVLRAAFTWAGWSAGALLTGYGFAVVVAPAGRGPVSVAFGCGLLLVGELAAWSVDLARTGREPARLGWRRAATLATLILGSGVAAAVVVVPTELLGTGHGLAVRGAGVAAAVAVLAILAWLASRIRPIVPPLAMAEPALALAVAAGVAVGALATHHYDQRRERKLLRATRARLELERLEKACEAEEMSRSERRCAPPTGHSASSRD